MTRQENGPLGSHPTASRISSPSETFSDGANRIASHVALQARVAIKAKKDGHCHASAEKLPNSGLNGASFGGRNEEFEPPHPERIALAIEWTVWRATPALSAP